MASSLSGKSLKHMNDLSRDEIREILDLARTVKRQRSNGEVHQRFLGRTLAMIFEKRSTRTRCAFETSFGEEGGHPVLLTLDDVHLGGKESIEDTARVLGRMFDAIQFRGYKQETVEALARYSGVPVYNGLTDDSHPTQVLADLMTAEERFGTLQGIKLCYCGDGRNNVARSLLVGCAKMGVSVSIAAPTQLFPPEATVREAESLAAESRSSIQVSERVEFAVKDADIVYTDVWVSMGEEDRTKERERLLKPFQVNAALMEKTGKSTSVFFHCLPAVKELEVTTEVFEGPQSLVFDQAENRKHTIKALMLATLF